MGRSCERWLGWQRGCTETLAVRQCSLYTKLEKDPTMQCQCCFPKKHSYAVFNKYRSVTKCWCPPWKRLYICHYWKQQRSCKWLAQYWWHFLGFPCYKDSASCHIFVSTLNTIKKGNGILTFWTLRMAKSKCLPDSTWFLEAVSNRPAAELTKSVYQS